MKDSNPSLFIPLLMNLKEIKDSVNSGLTVHWANSLYEVVHDSLDQWLVVCTDNGYTTGLQTKSGVLVEDPNKFYIA